MGVQLIGFDIIFRFAAEVRKQIQNPQRGTPVGNCFEQWAALYRGFAMERFRAFSRGGGDWAPLSPATIRARLYRKYAARDRAAKQKYEERQAARMWKRAAKGKTVDQIVKSEVKRNSKRYQAQQLKRLKRGIKARMPGSISILWDTGLLIGALDPGQVLDSAAPGAFGSFVPRGVHVGYGGSETHPGSGATIAQIATWHNFGTPTIPARPIIVDPPAQLTDRMSGLLTRAIERMWMALR